MKTKKMFAQNRIELNDKRKKVAVTCVAAVLLSLLYILIFSLSAQDAEESGSLSYQISEKCVEIVDQIAKEDWNADFRAELAKHFEHPIRKLAHFLEYTCMGILIYAIWSPWMRRNWKFYLLIIVWVLVSASADELHQTFVQGRYGSIFDVVLDSCGGCFGVFLSNIFLAFSKDSSS
jgi:VanZ family protein